MADELRGAVRAKLLMLGELVFRQQGRALREYDRLLKAGAYWEHTESLAWRLLIGYEFDAPDSALIES